MARDTRKRFEAALAKQRPEVRDAFLQAIADIKKTTNVGDLIRALESGDVARALATLRLGPEYFAPLDDAIRTAFASGGGYALGSLPQRNPATGGVVVARFGGHAARAEAKVAQLSRKLLDVLTTEEIDNVRRILVQSLSDGMNPRQTALDLVGRIDKLTGQRSGGVIGLDWQSKEWVSNYRAKLMAEGRDAAQVDRMVTRYSAKLLRDRGERIARTETLSAMNAGRDEGMRQLIDSGEVDAKAVTKTWDASGDARVRDTHRILDGQTVPLNEPFKSSTGAMLMHPGDTSLGAGAEDVINCRCYMSHHIDFFVGLE